MLVASGYVGKLVRLQLDFLFPIDHGGCAADHYPVFAAMGVHLQT